jgi:hypothetical protein
MSEIYIRRTKNNNNDIVTNDMLQMFLQEIEMVLCTPPTTVLGKPYFGVGLDNYLHDFNVNESEMRNIINRQIQNYCSLSGEFRFTINVEFFKTTNGDTAVVEILVEDSDLIRLVL